jgi:hypothetical protein
VVAAHPARSGERLRVENFRRVRAGLPQAEVEELRGRPPGNYGRHAGDWMVTCEGFIFPAKSTSVERIWRDDDSRFEIDVDGRDRVAAAHRRASYQQTPRDAPRTLVAVGPVATDRPVSSS